MQPNGARLPIVENYNAGVQRELKGGVVIDAAYVGTQTHHLLEGVYDYNQLNPSYLSQGTLLGDDINSPQAVGAGVDFPMQVLLARLLRRSGHSPSTRG